jgi:DNA polymerase III alpha subunit (gram-positive type)
MKPEFELSPDVRMAMMKARTSLANAHSERVAYLFADVETTGLDRVKDEAWEIAWSLRSSDGTLIAKRRILVEHRTMPSKWTIENTQYRLRMDSGEPLLAHAEVARILRSDLALARNAKIILVGSKPEFDDHHIAQISGGKSEDLYHHHHIDVGQLVAVVLDLPRPHNLVESAMLLGIEVDPHQLHESDYDRDLAERVFWTARDMRRRLTCNLTPDIWTAPEDQR